MKFLKRFLDLLHRRKLETEMAEEMRLHVELQAERNRAAGMSPGEAHSAAQRQFGNVASIQERVREARHWVWLEQFGQDLRYSGMAMRKSPGFTAVVVLTLALGLGVNIALFTWFNAVAFRPLPVVDPGQLFTLVRLDENGGERRSMSYAEFTAYRDHQTVFSGLTASDTFGVELADAEESNATTGEGPAARRIGTVATNYFTVVGVPMALGRPLLPTDENSSRAQPVIVLSHHFWQQHFNGDPAVIGRTIRLRGLAEEAVTVVGVSSPEFYGTGPGALMGWVPLLLRPGESWRTDRRAADYALTGRLRPGMSPEHAAEELRTIARAFLPPFAGPKARETITLMRASTYLPLTARHMGMLLPLISLFGLVLVVSAANASNLILARAVTRQFEFAVRSALGASRRRLFAQIMTESLVLGAMGGVVGWGVAAGLLRFVWPWLLNMVQGASEGLAGLNLHADHRVFGFTLAASLLAGAVGGLLPALQVTRRSVDSALKREGSAFGRKLPLARIRNFLAVAQLALSAALLFTAGLCVPRALGVEFRDVGFDQSRLLTFEVVVPRTHGSGQVDAARRQTLERLRTLPAVADITEMPRFPFQASRAEAVIPASGTVPASPAVILHLAVPAGYFSTLQLPLIHGRTFTTGEIATDHVAVISEAAARDFWPGENALGKRIEVPADIVTGIKAPAPELANDANRPRIALTVIGVVGDTRVFYPWSAPRPIVFLPLAPGAEAAPYLLIRTHDEAKPSLALLREMGREVTALVPRVHMVSELFDLAILQYRATAWVAGILAGLSLIVAVIGLHGVMAFSVNQREKEIGIRLALGATPGRVVSEIVFESLFLIGAGTTAGYGLSMAIAVVARSMLQGVDAFNPWTGISVALLLATIGLLACWLPARRAAKVDPVVALRAE